MIDVRLNTPTDAIDSMDPMESIRKNIVEGVAELVDAVIGDRVSGEPVVYLLSARHSARTYVGASLHLSRRLRQHNGNITGGARRTSHGGPWDLDCYVRGFRTWKEALQFEYAWRRVGRSVRRWDVAGRRRALTILFSLERWSSRSPLASEVSLELVI